MRTKHARAIRNGIYMARDEIAMLKEIEPDRLHWTPKGLAGEAYIRELLNHESELDRLGYVLSTSGSVVIQRHNGRPLGAMTVVRDVH